MLEKLQGIIDRYEELTALVADNEVIADQKKWQKLVKEHSQLTQIYDKSQEMKAVKKQISDAEEMLEIETDKEMLELLKEEVFDCKKSLKVIEEEIKVLLIPKDPDDDKNVVVEIRGGAGGDEAALFAGVLQRMYFMYAEKHKLKIEIVDSNTTEMGGVKESVFIISGKDAYAKLKFESGVHRVQRVPETESQGRVHTSTATVAVLPEAQDVEIEIEEKDLKIDTYRASGAGGQHVNKTESAIRITHLPTNIVVQCQNERSQLQNKENAMRMLKSKLYEKYQEEANKKYSENRKTQVGTGDRSERIRTYNYPQGRVTDHRIGFTSYNLEAFLNGDIDEMLEALIIADQQAKLAQE